MGISETAAEVLALALETHSGDITKAYEEAILELIKAENLPRPAAIALIAHAAKDRDNN